MLNFDLKGKRTRNPFLHPILHKIYQEIHSPCHTPPTNQTPSPNFPHLLRHPAKCVPQLPAIQPMAAQTLKVTLSPLHQVAPPPNQKARPKTKYPKNKKSPQGETKIIFHHPQRTLSCQKLIQI